MSRTERYPLRLLRHPVPAVATIAGRDHDVLVTAWRKKNGAWWAWCQLPDGQTHLVPADDVTPR